MHSPLTNLLLACLTELGGRQLILSKCGCRDSLVLHRCRLEHGGHACQQQGMTEHEDSCYALYNICPGQDSVGVMPWREHLLICRMRKVGMTQATGVTMMSSQKKGAVASTSVKRW